MSTFEISVQADFAAAHYLPDYDGPCKNMHGHRWGVKATYACDMMDEDGIALDIRLLKRILRNTVTRFDHGCLNDLFAHPTAEHIAMDIMQQLKETGISGSYLKCVTVKESPGCEVTYYG